MYEAEVSHKGLNKYRIVKAETRHELEEKTSALMAQWNEQWNRKMEREEKIKNDIENTRSYEDTNMRYARFFLDSYNKGLKQENRLNAGQLYM